MANHQNGGRSSAFDEHRAGWRPQDHHQATSGRARSNEDDHDYSSYRDRSDVTEGDPRRWEGSRGSELGSSERDRSATEYYGQGQSGYSAGRYGDDRAHQRQQQNRNEMWSPGHDERSYEANTDERWGGRGPGNWTERRDRGYDGDRFGAQSGYGRGNPQRRGAYDQSYGGYDQRLGNDFGPYTGNGISGDRMARMNDMGPYDQRMGYSGGSGPRGYDQRMGYSGGSNGQHNTDWSPSQRGVHEAQGPHVHRGNGPHRGKGPQGYQKSDERIRELVCEALADDDQIDASQIHVAVKDGEVMLTGTVDNRRIRREAEDCVANVSGVRDVQMQLRIKDEQREQRSQGSAQSHSTTGKIETEIGAGVASSDKKHRA